MKQKKVLIDGGPLFQHKTGIENYFCCLLQALFKIDQTNQYTIYAFLFLGKKMRMPFAQRYKNVAYRMIRYLPSRIYNTALSRRLSLPVDILTGTKPDIVLFGNFVRSPVVLGGKTITIIYDLSFIKFRKFADDKTASLLSREVPIAVRDSDVVIAISQYAKQEISDYYGVEDKKIEVVYPAVDHDIYYLRSKAEVELVRTKFGIQKSYILYAGTLEPRKNIVGIIEAYSRLDVELQKSYSLVLVGGKGWRDEEIRKKLTQFSHLDIIKTGYVVDEDLPAVYSGASLFVYPSFYEGFGMPPLEAMACGVPVITSDSSSLPEVVAEAGMQVRASEIDNLKAAMNRVLRSKKIREKMRASGLEQAKKFHWEDSALRLKEIIDRM